MAFEYIERCLNSIKTSLLPLQNSNNVGRNESHFVQYLLWNLCRRMKNESQSILIKEEDKLKQSDYQIFVDFLLDFLDPTLFSFSPNLSISNCISVFIILQLTFL